jgi:hypothetical protein
MLCGKLRNELQIQIQVSKCLQTVSENIMKNRYGFLEKKEHPWTIDLLQEEGKPKKEKKKKGDPAEGKMDRIKLEAKKDLIGLK